MPSFIFTYPFGLISNYYYIITSQKVQDRAAEKSGWQYAVRILYLRSFERLDELAEFRAGAVEENAYPVNLRGENSYYNNAGD